MLAFAGCSPRETDFLSEEKLRLESLVKHGEAIEVEQELTRLKALSLSDNSSIEDQFLLAYLRKLKIENKSPLHEKEAEAVAEAFQRISRRYPGHHLADDSLLEVGRIRGELLGQAVLARAAFFEVIDRYPESENIELAKSALEQSEESLDFSERAFSKKEEKEEISSKK